MDNESVLSTNVQLNNQLMPFSSGNVEQAISEVVAQAVLDRDPDIAFSTGTLLIQASLLSGLALAKLAYLLKKEWDKFGLNVSFDERAYQEWNINRTTLERYIRIWEMRDSGEVPPEIQEQIAERPLADQQAIATTWASGFEIKPEQWEKLATASDNNEVLSVLRDVKGEEPRSNSVSLVMDMDGSIWAWNQNHRYFVGSLEISQRRDDPIIDKAITRILSGAHIKAEY